MPCIVNPRRACRARLAGSCRPCLADHHNPALHHIYRLATERGWTYDEAFRRLREGEFDD